MLRDARMGQGSLAAGQLCLTLESLPKAVVAATEAGKPEHVRGSALVWPTLKAVLRLITVQRASQG